MAEWGSAGDTPSWEQVDYYRSRHQSALFRLSRSPDRDVVYEVDGATGTIALIVRLERTEPCPPSPSPSIEVVEVRYDGFRAVRVRSSEPDLVADFHELVTAMTTRIVRNGYTPAEALGDTIRSWHRLIDALRMQEATRIGLHGELLVLNAVAETFGWATAVPSWVGPHAEVHDFALPSFDIEVKTTSSERRRHRVNGLDQFTPKSDRDLWCVSVQAVRGGDAGRSLVQSADACLAGARSESVLLEAELAEALTAAGLSEFDAAARSEKWLLRSVPAVLRASTVPRIDAAAIPPEHRDRLSSVAYEVDLTGLDTPADAPLTFPSTEFP